jgi:hypothetical protein
MLIEPKLPQYFTLVNYQKFACLIGQNGYTAFIIFKVDEYMKLMFREKS